MSRATSNQDGYQRAGLLSRHLICSAAAHNRLSFNPDCPRCTNERLYGDRGSRRLAALRAGAAVTAGLLAFSTVPAPAAAASPGVPDQEYEGALPLNQETPTPDGGTPGLETDFDPGDDGDRGDFDVNPLVGGTQDDDGDGVPIESEPANDPATQIEPVPPPAPPSPDPAPEPVPPPPQQAPPVVLPQPPQPPEPLAPNQPEPPERQAGADRRPDPNREPERLPRVRTPAPAAPPPVEPPPIGLSPAAAPVTSVAVSQPTEPREAASEPSTAGRVAGSIYRVKEGDSLWSIARRLLEPGAPNAQLAREVDRLWHLNESAIGTGDPDLIFTGTPLRLR